MAHRLPLLADPGAGGDKALVRDIAQDQQQHLVRNLLHMAASRVLIPHLSAIYTAVNIST